MSTGIEWTDETWNPVVGCTKVSQGCKFCYAKTIHDMRHKAVLEGRGKKLARQYEHPFERVQLMPSRLGWPLTLRKPARIFVNSVSDLFHEDVPDDFIERVFAVMALAQRHTFQILTKRPERMRRWFEMRCGLESIEESVSRVAAHVGKVVWDARGNDVWKYSGATAAQVANRRIWPGWPLPNVWIGTSTENQEEYDRRVGELVMTPAAVHFISAEPLLGPIALNLEEIGVGADHGALAGGIDWVICGGESGSSKQDPRPMDPTWARSLRDQCIDGDVPFLFKQWGEYVNIDPPGSHLAKVGKKRAGRELDGRTWDEYPVVAR